MFEQLFSTNIFIYTMLGLCGLGFLIKFTLGMVYQNLIKASLKMGASKNKLVKDMKDKFETYHNLQLGVNNVDIFVDKCLYNHKFGGILLSTWESFCGQLLLGCVLIGSITTILGIVNGCGKSDILNTFSVGIVTSGLLIFFDSISNFGQKKERLRLNIINYLENVLKVKLEKGIVKTDLLEQYAVDINEFEKTGDLKTASLHNPTAKEGKVIRGMYITPQIKENRKERRKKLRQAKKRNKMLARQAKKEEKVVYKNSIKQAKDLEKERKTKEINKRKEEKIEKRLSKKHKKVEREKQLEVLRENLRVEEERKREEKRTEEELKRILSVEKALEKNKVIRTVAQEHKESLLKESYSTEIRNKKDVNEGSSKNIIEVVPLGEVEPTEYSSLEEAQKEIAAASERKQLSMEEQRKEQIRNVIDKGMKDGNLCSEELIDYILKNFGTNSKM